jgi:hypothetical protein
MTDDEIRNYLRPRHNWIGWIGGIAGALGTLYAAVSHFANAPTRNEFEQTRSDVVQIRLDQAVAKSQSERTAEDMAEVKVDLKALRESLEQKKRRNER